MFRRLWAALDRLAGALERLAGTFETAADDVEARAIGHQEPKQIEALVEADNATNGHRGRRRVSV
jgi:hypothetical protein